MSTKAKKDAKKEAAPVAAKAANMKPAAKKGGKTAAAEPEITELKAAPTEGADEEAEEEELTAASSSASGGGNAAALAAATTSTEMSASFKNFRHHPDMENFYRFIYENDLRLEALAIIDEMAMQKMARKAATAAKKQAH